MSSADFSGRIDELVALHGFIRERVEARLMEFRAIWETGDARALFIELAFCILTPQSGARRCGRALEHLLAGGVLFQGSGEEISDALATVRFRNNKARYLVEARERFLAGDESIRRIHRSLGKDVRETRRWIAENVKGVGYKEASHFLRNVGIGERLAILDRHVLRSMKGLGMIAEVPAAISPRRYIEMEVTLMEFASRIGIPPGHLDFLLWYGETGDIFK